MSLPNTWGQTSHSVTSEAEHSLKLLVNMARKYGLQEASTTLCTCVETEAEDVQSIRPVSAVIQGVTEGRLTLKSTVLSL